jgi:hypothetical protein
MRRVRGYRFLIQSGGWIRAISSRIVSGCELAADYFQSTMTCKPPMLRGDSSNLEEVVSSEEAYGAA